MREGALIIRRGGSWKAANMMYLLGVFGSLRIRGDIALKSLECYGSIIVDVDVEILDSLIAKGAILAKKHNREGRFLS
mgnify:CR=1 FL=1